MINYTMGVKTPAMVQVRYDIEGYDERDDGAAPVWAPIWTKVNFIDVVAMRFTPESACTELMIDAYSRVCEVVGSRWLIELGELFKEAHEDISPAFHHFMIFFDHYGCLEVISTNVEVENE